MSKSHQVHIWRSQQKSTTISYVATVASFHKYLSDKANSNQPDSCHTVPRLQRLCCVDNDIMYTAAACISAAVCTRVWILNITQAAHYHVVLQCSLTMSESSRTVAGDLSWRASAKRIGFDVQTIDAILRAITFVSNCQHTKYLQQTFTLDYTNHFLTVSRTLTNPSLVDLVSRNPWLGSLSPWESLQY